MSSIKEQVKYTDSKLMGVIRWFAWIAASLISAAINVWFISQLASHVLEMVIYGVVAIVLECGKLNAVLRANIFSALYSKVEADTIKRKRNSSYVVYAIYASFAILCATGYSVNMTTTTIGNYDTQIELLEQQKSNVLLLQGVTPIPDELTRANVSYDNLQELFLTTNREDDAIQYAYRTKAPKDDGSTYSWAESNASSARLRSVTNDRNAAEQRWRDLQTQYDQTEVVRKEELARSIGEYGSLMDLDTRIGQLKVNKAMNAGSSQIFITIGNTIGWDPNVFRLVILIFLSFLIEYIVFSMAPTSKVNRKLLYDYREYIPSEAVALILQKFDEELDLYLGQQRDDDESEEYREMREKLHAAELTIGKLTEDAQQPPPPPKPKKKRRPPQKRKPVLPQVFQTDPISDQPSIRKMVEDTPITPTEERSPPPTAKFEEVRTLKEDDTIETKVEEKPTNEETHLYRYGRSTEKIRDKFSDFLTTILPDLAGPLVIGPDDGARMAGISNRLKETFLKRLTQLKQLYQEDDRWYSTDGKSEVIAHVTEMIDPR